MNNVPDPLEGWRFSSEQDRQVTLAPGGPTVSEQHHQSFS